MREFLQVLRRFIPPYKKYLMLSILFNVLSVILNVFSFAALIPILQILFKTGDSETVTSLMAWDWHNVKEVLMNNMNYYVNQLIADLGPTTTLLVIGLFLAVMTFLKTGAYFLSSATIIPIRTGVVRDIRNQLYHKITSQSLGFFSEERKGDIIARMSGDVQEIENSIMSSLEMLFKNPILIIGYFTILLFISWQLTLFTLIIVPVMGWFMGLVGRKLKKKSIKAQALWSDTMSQVEETLGGLRIIKAFCAEEKMNSRFDKVNTAYRNDIMRVNIRQSMAHPMSEFLGTVMIVIVLWFGGVLVLNNHTLSGPIFIYYLVMLYSIINPLKDFSKAGYNIPKGLASMERVDKILLAEVSIKEPENPKHIDGFNHEIEFRHVSFKYGEQWVLRHINLTDFHRNRLRSLIGNVNQESILFNDSFYNNIAFGVPNATREQVEEAAKIANAHEFIIASEKGYDTFVGDRGGRLSGGQRQRVSIARAILKNPPILILDEATSALDTESERLVQDALERLMKTRTTVAIAHRLSTIRNADEICVIHDGRIVERGTHESLIADDGYYKKLHDMQA